MAGNGVRVHMTPSHPGDFIRTEIMDDLGLNVNEGGGDSRRPPGDAFGPAELQSSFVTGNGPACREKPFGVGMPMLLRMQAWYDASQMRARRR